MKTYWRSEDIAPRILDLGTRWWWVVSYTPRERAPDTHWVGGLVGTKSQSWRGGEDKSSQLLPGLETPIILAPHTLNDWPY
jgi:hypothetical protein